MNLKLPYEKTHRAPRSIPLLLTLLALGAGATGCGLSDDDAPDETTRTETTRTETTATTQTTTAPENTQSTDVPSTERIQGASPGVPSAPQGATPESQQLAQQQALTDEQLEAQENERQTQGTTGGTGSGAPDAAGNLPEGSQSGSAAPVVGASGTTGTPRSRFGAFEGTRPFSDASPWNTLASGLPTDARSAEMMRLANIRIAIIDRENGQLQEVEETNREGLFINTRAWAPPIYTEQGGVTTALRCRQLLRACGDPVEALSIPADARPDPRYDGWFTIYDSPNGVAYDFWRARRESDGSISYHFVRRWDLNDSGYLPPQRVSARGSGLPLFAGVITPQDLQRGRIEHALAISVPGAAQRRYVQPASRTDGNGRITSLPEGARIRLRNDITAADLLNPERSRRARRNRDRTRGIDDLFEDQPQFDELDTTSGDPSEPLNAPRDPVTGERLRDDEDFQTELNYEQLEAALRPQRFRVSERTRRQVTEMIVEALKRYGAIVVDRSAVPTLYAQRNVDWRGILTGGEVQGIQLSDFEVIQLGPVYNDPPFDSTVAVALPGQQAGVSGSQPQAGGATTAPPAATTTTTAPSTTSTTESGE